MKQKTYDLKKLARVLTGRWYGEYGGILLAKTISENQCETVVHELAHFSVFSERMKPPPPGDIGHGIDKVFMSYVDNFASDRSELQAVAIEILVCRIIGLKLFEKRLVNNAKLRYSLYGKHAGQFFKDDMYGRWFYVNRYMKQQLTQRRVDRVVAWIDEVYRSAS